MTCSKCHKENPDDSNFCRFCAEPLKEKCSECGEMERIGRAVCFKKVMEVKEALKAQMLNFNPLSFAIGIICTALLMIFLWPSAESPLSHYFLPILFCGISSLYFSVVAYLLIMIFIKPRLERKARKKLFHIHPEYKEILDRVKRKGEGGQR